DGLITDPRSCTFHPRALQCPGAEGPACLTKTQVEAVLLYASDLKNSYGDVVSPAWPLTGDEAAGMQVWKTGTNPPPLDASGVPNPPVPTIASPLPGQAYSFSFEIGAAGWQGFNDPNWSWRSLNLEKDGNYLVQLGGTTSAL